MLAFRSVSASWVHKTVTALLGAAAMFLAGCAMEHAGTGARTHTNCRVNSVLYCNVDARPGLAAMTCQCIRSRVLGDMLGTLSRP